MVMVNAHIPFRHIHGWLFDLDGTLMDTDDEAVAAIAAEIRFPNRRRAQQLARRLVMFSETPMNQALTLLDIVGLDPLVFALQRKFKHQLPPTYRLVPGVRPLLMYLATIGKVAIVSTRPEEAVQAFLQQHNLEDLFVTRVTCERTKRLKPSPQPIFYAAQEMDLSVSECVMVGDTPVDVRAARRAGAWAIGVLCGFGEKGELIKAGAHLILPTTANLLPVVLSAR